MEWRILASEDNTTVTFDPPVSIGAQVVLDAGEMVQFDDMQDFFISADDPILVVTTLSQKIPEEAQAEFCTQRIQASPIVKDLELVASGEVEADGIKGCEALARGMDRQTGRPMMVYEANLFEGSRYYNFNGLAGVRFRAEYVSEFARTARRIRRK